MRRKFNNYVLFLLAIAIMAGCFYLTDKHQKTEEAAAKLKEYTIQSPVEYGSITNAAEEMNKKLDVIENRINELIPSQGQN